MPSPQLHHSAHHLRPQLRTSPQSISTLVVDLHWTHVGWCDHLDGCQQYDNAMQGQTHGQQTGLGTQNIYLLMQRGTALPRRGGRLGAWVTFSGRSVFHWKHGPWTRRSKFRTIGGSGGSNPVQIKLKMRLLYDLKIRKKDHQTV